MRLNKISVTQEDIDNALADAKVSALDISHICPVAKALLRTINKPNIDVIVQRGYTDIKRGQFVIASFYHSDALKEYIRRFDNRGKGHGIYAFKMIEPHTFKIPTIEI